MNEVPQFNVFGVLGQGERQRNMDIALLHGFPRLAKQPPNEETMSIACFGPSLADTWQKIQRPVMTVSGAHDFLIERGFVPDFHMDCDPRPHKTYFTEHPHQAVHYLMASCCDPQSWKNLADQKVSLWHVHNDDDSLAWVAKNDPDYPPIGGGSSAGMRALMLGNHLGYHRFHIHGMDCCFRGNKRHAGKHSGKPQIHYEVILPNGMKFDSSPQMVEEARQLCKMPFLFKIDLLLYGNGLAQEMMRYTVQAYGKAA